MSNISRAKRGMRMQPSYGQRYRNRIYPSSRGFNRSRIPPPPPPPPPSMWQELQVGGVEGPLPPYYYPNMPAEQPAFPPMKDAYATRFPLNTTAASILNKLLSGGIPETRLDGIFQYESVVLPCPCDQLTADAINLAPQVPIEMTIDGPVPGQPNTCMVRLSTKNGALVPTNTNVASPLPSCKKVYPVSS